MGTQWHVGMSGPTGLVYASLDRVERACQVSAEQSGEVFAGVQIMERSTLKVLADRAAAAHKR